MAQAQEEFGSGTVGDRLRRAREEQGLTLEDVANRTRVPIRHLRAIEDSDWQELPAVTYTVGFGKAYANAIGMDGTAVGQELRDLLGGGQRTPQVSPEFYAPPDPARVPSRSLAWVAGLLLVALIAIYLIWRSQLGSDDDAPKTAAQQQTEAPVQAQQAQPSAPAQDLAGQQVTLVAAEDVWFQVNDAGANNRAVRTGQLAAGEQYPVPRDLQRPVIRTSRPHVLIVRVGDREVGRLSPREGLVKEVSLLSSDVAARAQSQGAPPPTR